MRVPSTPARVARVCSSTVPWAGVSRKPLQAYVTPAAAITLAIPYSSRFQFRMFIVFRPLSKDASLERGRNADRDRAVAGIRPLVHTAELIPNVAGGPEDARGGQGGIEPRIPGDGEQVFRLQVHARGRDPADHGRGQAVADLQGAQPDVRAVLDPI